MKIIDLSIIFTSKLGKTQKLFIPALLLKRIG